LDQYESSLKIYRDLYSVIDSAFIEGKTEGIEEGRQEGLQVGRQESKRDMAKLLKDNGAQVDLIILSTGFTKEEIDLL
jgi:predicted transposase/invertase (TIGR01784 family)